LRILKQKYIGWALGALFFGLLISLPLFFVLEGFADIKNENVAHINEYLLADMILTTLRMILGTGCIALVLGVPAAYFVANFKFPFRTLMLKANVLPAAIPTYIIAFVYASIFSVTGTFQRFAELFFSPETIYGWGIDVVNEGFLMLFLGFALYPYVYSAALVSFSIKNKAVEEAAASLGSGPVKRFFSIVLPLSLSAIMGGVALVAMEVLNDYGAMSYYNVKTMTAGIFQAKQMDFSSSVYLSALTFSAIVVLFTGYYVVRMYKRVSVLESTNSFDRIKLKGWQAGAVSILVFFPFFLGFILPVFELLLLAGSNIQVVFTSEFGIILLNSIQLAIYPAIIIVVIALIMLYNEYLNPSKVGTVVSTFATIGYAVPGAVIAVALISFVIRLDNENLSFYHFLIESLVLLMFAYIVRFLAVGYNTLYGGFSRISESVPDAARSLGSGGLITFSKIYFPLLKGAVFTTLAVVTVDILKELPLTLLLQRFNFDTLATKTYEQAKINESVADAAPYALLLIFAGVLAILLLMRNTDSKQ
jgi:iron(III) transport system permease protein